MYFRNSQSQDVTTNPQDKRDEKIFWLDLVLALFKLWYLHYRQVSHLSEHLSNHFIKF